jgi:hypothetical protein
VSLLVGGVLGGGAHRELVHVGLAEHHQAGLLDLGADRRVVGRTPALQDLRARGGRQVFGDHDILHRQRHAGQRPELFTQCLALIHRPGSGESAFGIDVQERLDRAVHLVDPVEMGGSHLDSTC